jgi:hypothetical protein
MVANHRGCESEDALCTAVQRRLISLLQTLPYNAGARPPGRQ